MRLAVGVSGGADSVALLRALHARSGELGLALHVAHLHHGLRGAEADADLEFVRELAARLDLPFHCARVDTAEEAAARPGKAAETIEEAARRLRYRWFRGLMGGSLSPVPKGEGSGAPAESRPDAPDDRIAPSLRDSGDILNAGFPTLKRGANNHCASGAAGLSTPHAAGSSTPHATLNYAPMSSTHGGSPLEAPDGAIGALRGVVDAVATAHTLDDQAETVLAKFLRGAWTEGLSGIHPVVEFAEGRIVRPLLGTTRAEVEAYLRALGQEWREDSSNRHLTYTRNRIRHELLPALESWNPRLREHLAQMADLARDEEAWWESEVARMAPEMTLTGTPVRGGGRAAAEVLAVDLKRLGELAPALQRRVLRHVAGKFGAAPDFPATEALRQLALGGRAGQKCELAGGVRAERTHRELRLSLAPAAEAAAVPELAVAVPGETEAPGFGLRFRIEAEGPERVAMLRAWRAGDRVTLQHSSGPRKVKEVLERMKVSGSARAHWPVLELDGRIVWMQGVAADAGRGMRVVATPIEPAE
ncbi:MAG: tRNA lysidine(34) synthetase TilS [Acidobacteriota bacterium]